MDWQKLTLLESLMIQIILQNLINSILYKQNSFYRQELCHKLKTLRARVMSKLLYVVL